MRTSKLFAAEIVKFVQNNNMSDDCVYEQLGANFFNLLQLYANVFYRQPLILFQLNVEKVKLELLKY